MKKYIPGMIICVGVLGFITVGWAEESAAGKHGIRIAIRNSPGIDEVEVEDDFGSTTFSTDADDGTQIDIMYAKRFMGRDGNNTVGGFVAGGVFLAGSSGTDSFGDEGELSAFGIIGEGGVAVQLGRVVVLEGGGFLGLGGADMEITSGGFSTSETGAYATLGFKGGIYFQIGDHIELGLEAGYSSFASMAQFNDPFFGDTLDVTFSGDGFQGGGVLAVKF